MLDLIGENGTKIEGSERENATKNKNAENTVHCTMVRSLVTKIMKIDVWGPSCDGKIYLPTTRMPSKRAFW